MKSYDHKKIEKKWQEAWEKDGLYKTEDKSLKPKYYCLIEFPYPSGEGLHVGHIRSNTAMDIIARKRRAEGYNVLYPIGWDAFGLPTENYAIKTKTPPSVVIKENTDIFRRQLKLLGFSFDWSREINTTDPKYYKWTQWMFIQFFKHGLAYKKKTAINWCVDCKIGLANEEVVDGACERCGGATEKREKEQWMLAITKYADRLYDDLDTVDYSERIKIQQRNWIGRSEGAEIEFNLQPTTYNLQPIKVFTTRPDTLFGATYMVLAPEHELVTSLLKNKEYRIKNIKEIQKYIEKTKKKTEIERTAEGKEKTGVELKGIKAINPANKEEISIWVADYVLKEYGTGAIMAVPGHDQRDFEFAQKFNLPVKQVICQFYPEPKCPILEQAYTGEGYLVGSEKFDGTKSEEAKKEITEFVGGKMKTAYKLRDWVFSRQRYWGEPIPLVFCQKDGWVAVAEDDLPVELPEVKAYTPTDTGDSPLAKIDSWVNVKCPKCKGEAKRETDTMPNWAGSSWYYLRYIDPHNDKVFADRKKLDHFMPVDWYNGGMEHTTLHLLYSRFWHKLLFDIKAVPNSEPYAKRTSHGLILAEGGEKMSKSKGNVVNPDDIVAVYGADTLRLYEMFMGPFEQSVGWSTDSIIGPRRFLERIWKLKLKVKSEKLKIEDDTIKIILNKTIKKVGEDIESMHFNTAVSGLMILANEMEKVESISQDYYETFLRLLSPFAPHITEELWHEIGHASSIHIEPWPKYDEMKLSEGAQTIVIQINGKVRGSFVSLVSAKEEEIKEQALAHKTAQKWMEGKPAKKVLYVPGKLVSIVV